MIKAILTIDDIPSKNTPAIVDYLNGKGIKAIMFAIGRELEKFPGPAVYALKHGMIVGNHSYSHPAFSELSLDACIEEIERCEQVLDSLYGAAGMARTFRPFRFPYGDKGGKNRAAIRQYLCAHGFSKVKDTELPWSWWKESALDRDIDTLWTYDFQEYAVRPGSGYTMEDVLRKMHDPMPNQGAPLFEENGRHILVLHAHDETEEMAPGYYKTLIGRALDHGVTFEEPAFMQTPHEPE